MKKATLIILLLSMSLFSQEWYETAYDSITDIEIRVDRSNGLYAIGTHDASNAISHNFNAPESISYSMGNSFTIKIEDDIYQSHASFGPSDAIDIDPYYIGYRHDRYEDEDVIISRWEVPAFTGFFAIYQKLFLQTADDTIGRIKVEYMIQNQNPITFDASIKVFNNFTFANDSIAGDIGSLYSSPDEIPDNWIIYEYGMDDERDQLIVLGEIGENIPEYFGFGEYYYGEFPIIANPWTIEPESWIDTTLMNPGIFMRWPPITMRPSDYSLHSYYLTITNERFIPAQFHINDSLLIDCPEVNNCIMDSIITLSSSITNDALRDLLYDVVICLDFNESSDLENFGPTCDSIGNLIAMETKPFELQFSLPEDYSYSSVIDDTLRFDFYFTLSGYPDTISLYRNFHIPYLNHIPPSVEFLDTSFAYSDSTSVRFQLADDDTAVDFSSIYFDLITEDTIYCLNPYSGIYRVEEDIAYFSVDRELISSTYDTILIDDDFDLCITSLKDMFGCAIDTYCVSIDMADEMICDLDEGWNMLSFPFATAVDLRALLPDSPAPFYVFNPLSGIYDAIVSLQPCQGVWYYSDYDTNLSIEGYFTAEGTMTFYPGWNLIGMPNIEVYIDTLAPDDLILPAYKYEAESRVYSPSSVLIPGIGYFIYSENFAITEFE